MVSEVRSTVKSVPAKGIMITGACTSINIACFEDEAVEPPLPLLRNDVAALERSRNRFLEYPHDDCNVRGLVVVKRRKRLIRRASIVQSPYDLVFLGILRAVEPYTHTYRINMPAVPSVTLEPLDS